MSELSDSQNNPQPNGEVASVSELNTEENPSLSPGLGFPQVMTHLIREALARIYQKVLGRQIEQIDFTDVPVPRSDNISFSHLPQIKTKPADPETSDNIIQALLIDSIFPNSINGIIEKVVVERLKGFATYGYSRERMQQLMQGMIKDDKNRILNMARMTKLRERATMLLDAYTRDEGKDSSLKQAAYYRRSLSLWEQMVGYVEAYYAEGSWIQGDSLDKPTGHILDELRKRIPQARAFAREKNPHTVRTDVEIVLPAEGIDGNLPTNNHELLMLRYDGNGKITEIEIHSNTEMYGCSSIDLLLLAYQRGKKLSSSQLLLLKEVYPEERIGQEVLDGTKIPGEKTGFTMIVPIVLLGKLFPQSLISSHKNLVGKLDPKFVPNGEDFQLQSGPLVIKGHEHDHTPFIEWTTRIDTRDLSEEEIFQIIGLYINILRDFPRVNTLEKSSS